MAMTPLSEALERILATVEIKPDWEMVALEAALVGTAQKPLTPPSRCHQPITAPWMAMLWLVGMYRARSPSASGSLRATHPCRSRPARRQGFSQGRKFPLEPMPSYCRRMLSRSRAGHLARCPAGAAYPSAGSDIQPGDELVAAGHRLTPQDIGLLASVGLDAVPVFRPLNVAVLTTGDELREPGSGDLDPGQIFNSNRFSLAAQIRALGMNVIDCGNLPDDPDQIGEALERAAAEADCIVTAGGVSVGEEDHVKSQIEQGGRWISGSWRSSPVSHWHLVTSQARPSSDCPVIRYRRLSRLRWWLSHG